MYSGDSNTPDDDFLDMTTASVFVPSGSGYCSIAHRMVRASGNSVVQALHRADWVRANVTVAHPYDVGELCFLAAFSENHVNEYFASYVSIREHYPHARRFIYDLGLREETVVALEGLDETTRVIRDGIRMEHHQIDFEGGTGACAFRAPVILQFMNAGHFHKCSLVAYFDTSIHMKRHFDTGILNELFLRGIVTQQARVSACVAHFLFFSAALGRTRQINSTAHA